MTGKQGVVIPASNRNHLMLKEEVVHAVREGKFNVWTVSTIDEGIEIPTGKQAGEKKKGVYEEGSVSHLADRQLKILPETLKELGAGPAGKKSAEQG
jgi:predicted ATP-dependent protease